MRKVTYSLSVSADGYIKDAEGNFDFGQPDPDVFALAINEVRGLGVHFLGRHLYESMLYWHGKDEDSSLDEPQLEFARIWNALPKVVFSRTLASVEGNARLATGDIADEIAQWRAQPGEGSIGIGGASLAAEVARLGLIDEYLVRVYPALVGGGTTYFAQHGHHVDLELLEHRIVGASTLYLRYGVKR